MVDNDKILLAIKKRHEYDAEQARVLRENDPNGAEIMGLVAGAWLDAERALSIEEYIMYQAALKRGDHLD